MGAFGDKLRRERERRGISLDQIATATKISTRMLKAIEEEKFDLLPGGIFNKGFIRAYAKAVGIDEEQTVADYVAASGPEETVDYLPQMAEQVQRPERPPDESTISWTMITVLVLLLVCAYGGWRFYTNRKAQQESGATRNVNSNPILTPQTSSQGAEASSEGATPAALSSTSQTKPSSTERPATRPVVSSPAEPAATIVPARTQSVVADSSAPVQVVIRTSGDSWILAIADGKTVLSEIVPASSEKHVAAEHRISMTIGNAAAVQLTQNGKPLPSLGPEGSVRNLIFTPDGFRFQPSE